MRTTVAPPEGKTTGTDGAGRLRRWTAAPGERRWLALLVALAVILGVAAATLVWLVLDRASAVQDGADAERSARMTVERILTYDAKDLEPTRQAIDEDTVGPFRDQFVDVFTQVVSPNARAQQASGSAVTRQSGLVTREPGRVVVLLFITQTTKTTALPGDRIDTIQARVTMTESDDRWLVSGLDQV